MGCRHVHGKNRLAYRQVCVQREKWSWGCRESTVCICVASLGEEVKLVYMSISTAILLQLDSAVNDTCNNRSVSEQGMERGRGVLVRESPCHHSLSACGFPLPGQALTCSDLMCSDV